MALEKKLKDPTEAALSAIEQALNLDPAAGPAREEAGPRLPEVKEGELIPQPGPRLERPSNAPDLPPVDRDPPRPTFVAPDRTAVANDDRQTVGLMIQALQTKASRRPLVLAILSAIAWIGGLGGYAAGTVGLDNLLAGFSPLQLIVAVTVLLAPPLLFVVAGLVLMRTQEMRVVARAMGEVVLRLAQPETLSTDAVLTVSQAVRREVAAVNDGVERALARAGELETLVRGEISTLERAYSDNEIRIRSLVDELVAQREAIVTHAERARTAIVGSHQTLTQDLDTAAQRIVQAVNAAGDRVNASLDTRSDEITAALDRAEKIPSGLYAGAGRPRLRINVSRSSLSWSLCVAARPWGPPS